MNRRLPLPGVVVHADWSTRPAKRWAVAATRQNGRYTIHPPAPANLNSELHLEPISEPVAGSGRFLGVDLPLGLPRAYAAQTGHTRFLNLLPKLGHGRWSDFYRPAVDKEEIAVTRPFYPHRPGGTKQRFLVDGLSVTDIDALRRRCDLPTAHRGAAAPLFWTMGAQQVGKAAITFWRDVLAPARHAHPDRIRVWPFHGRLRDLLAWAIETDGTVIAEVYPAECYHHLGVRFPTGSGGKRNREARQANTAVLQAWATDNEVCLSPGFAAALTNGFGDDNTDEDKFDAAVGVMGMINILHGRRRPYDPTNEIEQQMEGWILGAEPPQETV